MREFIKYKHKETGEIICAELVWAHNYDGSLEDVYLVSIGDLSEEEYDSFQELGKNQIIEVKPFHQQYEELNKAK